MDNSKSTIGMPVEQGFYTLILGIKPEGAKIIYFYDESDKRANGCMIYGVSIHESISDMIPTCKVEVEVPYTWIDNQCITDGTLISIDMKINESIAEGMKEKNLNEKAYIFRLFKIDKLEDHGIFVKLSLHGVIDFMAGYGDANKLNCACTTSKVFNTCADEFKFPDKDIDTTKDKQLWIANGRTVYQFLTYCCQYGYVDDTSAMMWAIDRNKKLYYKNIVKCFDCNKAASNCANGNCSGGGCLNIRVGSYGVPVVTHVPFGINNVQLGGYGANGDTFKLVDGESCKYDYNFVISDDLTKTSESTCVCKNCECNNPQDWFPFDVGNHNEKYFKAACQNRQVLSTYSTFMSIQFTPSTGLVAKNSIVPFFEAFHLFDACNIEYDVHADKGQYTKMAALTTKAMVETIDVNITQKYAATKIKFVTQGFNTKGKTN